MSTMEGLADWLRQTAFNDWYSVSEVDKILRWADAVEAALSAPQGFGAILGTLARESGTVEWPALGSQADNDSPVSNEKAFESGWRAAAKWANREDLIADIGSPAYERDAAGVREVPLKLRLCESERLVLRPNQPYIFTVDPNCTRCVELAAAASAIGGVETGDGRKP